MPTKTTRLVTLGCKVNQYETQLARESLLANGYREAQAGEPADLVVVNSCTVTSEADAQTRQVVRHLHRSNPAASIVVMGCYATRDPETLHRLPGVVRVITDKGRLMEELKPFGVQQGAACISRLADHKRAFVKVQDGCLLNCTFCIIPSVRPRMQSRPVGDIVEEIRGLIDSGCREVVLTGIHLGHYGIDLSRGRPKHQWTRLWHLVDRVSQLPGDFRLRLSSLEGAEIRNDLLRVLRGNPRVCPHLHICLQSGSDRILGLMRRRYRVGSFLERCSQVREVFDNPALTTDVIVGFPGETEADFESTCEVLERVGFAKTHIFPFSPRRGTVAATMPDQVPHAVLAERRRRLAALDADLAARYARSLVGRGLQVLGERLDPEAQGHVLGMACRRVMVRYPGGIESINGLTQVRVRLSLGDRLEAERICEDVKPVSGINNDRVPPVSRVALPVIATEAD